MATQYKMPIYTPSGDLHDASHRPLATEEYVDDAISSLGLEGQPKGLDEMPAKTVITINKSIGGVWPGVPTTRSDIVMIWRGPSPAPPTVTYRILGMPGMLQGVDIGLFV